MFCWLKITLLVFLIFNVNGFFYFQRHFSLEILQIWYTPFWIYMTIGTRLLWESLGRELPLMSRAVCCNVVCQGSFNVKGLMTNCTFPISNWQNCQYPLSWNSQETFFLWYGFFTDMETTTCNFMENCLLPTFNVRPKLTLLFKSSPCGKNCLPISGSKVTVSFIFPFKFC